jgi:hypothetical protein
MRSFGSMVKVVPPASDQFASPLLPGTIAMSVSKRIANGEPFGETWTLVSHLRA